MTGTARLILAVLAVAALHVAVLYVAIEPGDDLLHGFRIASRK